VEVLEAEPPKALMRAPFFGVHPGDVLHEDVGDDVLPCQRIGRGGRRRCRASLGSRGFRRARWCGVGFEGEGDAVVAVDDVVVGYRYGGAAVDVPAGAGG
jgi:hypothetical protein